MEFFKDLGIWHSCGIELSPLIRFLEVKYLMSSSWRVFKRWVTSWNLESVRVFLKLSYLDEDLCLKWMPKGPIYSLHKWLRLLEKRLKLLAGRRLIWQGIAWNCFGGLHCTFDSRDSRLLCLVDSLDDWLYFCSLGNLKPQVVFWPFLSWFRPSFVLKLWWYLLKCVSVHN